MAIALAVVVPVVSGADGGQDAIVATQPVTTAPCSFAAADEELLNQIERGCFLYFWNEVGSPSGLVRDRKKAPVASVAAAGFQLSALPIGVERGWISREDGRARARSVLKALIERDDNKKFGVYLHYPDLNTGGISKEGFEILASTIDHALLVAGAIPAATYFGGDVETLVDRLIAETNWRAFVHAPDGYVSMGWQPNDPTSVSGPGRFIDACWTWASDEERLVCFLGAGAPKAEYALDPAVYYRLKRVVKRLDDGPPFVASWPGSVFSYVFSQCWIDYRRLQPDDPRRFGAAGPSVDWFENSRRAILAHRARCIQEAGRYHTLSPERWGLSPCSARDGYAVPEIQPNARGDETWCDGTVAPYAAGSAVMITPQESMVALRAFRKLTAADGTPLIWRDPGSGGYGFVDSFNLDQKFVCDDYVGIDQGPMLLGIENARTGLIWRLFMKHDAVRRCIDRLKLVQR